MTTKRDVRNGLVSTLWTEELLASSGCKDRCKELWIHYPYYDTYSRKYYCVVWRESGRRYRSVHKEHKDASKAYNDLGEMNVPDKAEH